MAVSSLLVFGGTPTRYDLVTGMHGGLRLGFLEAISQLYLQLHTARVRCWLGAITTVLGTVFVLALHPVTGPLGGMFIIFIGWAVPSILNLLASLFVLACLPREFGRHPIAIVVAGVVTSFLIAVMPEAPAIVQRLTTPPVVTSDIARVVAVPEGNLSISSPPLYVVANPLAQVIWMGSNEGCGCSYWSVTDADPGMFPRSYVGLLSEDLNQRTGGRGIFWSRDAKASIAVTEAADHRDPSRVDIAIEIRDSGKVTAELHEFAVPRYPQGFITSDRAPLSRGPFAKIAWHDLTHDTFWSQIVGVRLGYYPRSQIQEFLREAIAVRGRPPGEL